MHTDTDTDTDTDRHRHRHGHRHTDTDTDTQTHYLRLLYQANQERRARSHRSADTKRYMLAVACSVVE